jgi:hypothetical protein
MATHLALVKAAADDDALHAAPGLVFQKSLHDVRQLHRVVFRGGFDGLGGHTVFLQQGIQLLFAEFARGLSAHRVLALHGCIQLAPRIEHVAKGCTAGDIPHIAFAVAQFQAIAFDDHRGQPHVAMWPDDAQLALCLGVLAFPRCARLLAGGGLLCGVLVFGSHSFPPTMAPLQRGRSSMVARVAAGWRQPMA